MRRAITPLLLCVAAAACAPAPATAPPPPRAAAASASVQVPSGTEWIWRASPDAASAEKAPPEEAWFTGEFQLEHAPIAAQLGFTADNHASVWLNGALVGDTDEWREPRLLDVGARLVVGRNTLQVAARNDGGPAGLLAFVVADGQPVYRTDAGTHAFGVPPPGLSASASDSAAPANAGAPAADIAPYGAEPWGRLTFGAEGPVNRNLVPAEGLQCEEVASGFGSLIALALDAQGAPVVSVERGGLLRLHDDDGDGRFERASTFCDEVRACQGLGFLGADAWVTADGPAGLGFYRLRATVPSRAGADEPPRHAELVAPIKGTSGEHGPHAVVPGPDGRLWIMLGNHVRLGTSAAASSPCCVVYEGHVLPRILDPNGHATEVTAPGGTLFAFDPATQDFQLYSDGYRNAYDIAFAPDGDLFTFDSDMEWDIGLPWYRAVRVVHVLPGGDYGWRTGSGDWPSWYPDSLPPLLDTGRGSPTGMVWCDSDAFPPAWRGTLLLGDWSQGQVLAVRLAPDGISYRGRSQVLLSGRPLPVTDLAFERSGALLISVGGRGTKGALLRLRGAADGAASDAHATAAAPATFVPAARPPVFTERSSLDEVTEALASPDRAVRYLAARALEQRVPADAESVAAADSRPAVRAEALLVLARQAVAAGRTRTRASAGTVDDGPVDDAAQRAADGERGRFAPALVDLLQPAVPLATRLIAVRALEVLLLAGVRETLAGDGQPADPALGAALLPLFPSGDPALDRELAALLARTEPAGARAALLDALDDETSAEESVQLLYCLSALRGGADAAQTRTALERLTALRARPGGASYQGYLDAIERRLVAQAPEDQREALRAEAQPAVTAAGDAAAAGAGAGVALVHDAAPRDSERTLAYVRNALDAPERSTQEGAWVFSRTCAACHVKGTLGKGGGGPDLTSVGSRMDLPDLLTAMMAPSRDVSDQYRATQVFTKSGRVVQGLVRRDDGRSLQILTTTGQTESVDAAEIDERRLSRISPMPDGLLDGLSLRAIADLCAFLLAPTTEAAPAHSAWQPLFDGGAPDEWNTRGVTSSWLTQGGVLRGERTQTGTAESLLVSPWDVWDFAFECEVMVPGGTCGVVFHAGDAADGLQGGTVVDLGGSTWGSLSAQSGGDVLAASEPALWKPEVDPAGWNHLLIEAHGPRIRVVLDGIEIASLSDAARTWGRLALRLGPDEGASAAFRFVSLRRDD